MRTTREARPTDRPAPDAGLDDRRILQAVAAGDWRDFDAFVDRYKGRLFGYMRRWIRDRHQCEDLLQDVFLSAFRAAANGVYAGRGSAAPWLFTIARNRVLDHLRTQGRRPTPVAIDESDERDTPPSPTPDPAAAAAAGEQRSQVEAAVSQLPETQQEVVTLWGFGGLSLREVAEVTGAALGTVKSRMRYALEKIRNRLNPDGGRQP